MVSDFIYEDVMQYLNIFKYGPVSMGNRIEYYRLNAEFIKWILEEEILEITRDIYSTCDSIRQGKNYKLVYDQLTLDQRILNKLLGE